jgi:uncharacterized protein (DUF1501 family)
MLRQFGAALAAFSNDMGDRMEDIVLPTMSEFGRTAEENGNGGGGKIYGKWPGLESEQLEQLNDQRDLAVTTDFRAVLSELVAGQRG